MQDLWRHHGFIVVDGGVDRVPVCGTSRHFVEYNVVQLQCCAVGGGKDHCSSEVLQCDMVDDRAERGMDKIFLRVSEIKVVMIQIYLASVNAVAYAQEPRGKVRVLLGSNVVSQ